LHRIDAGLQRRNNWGGDCLGAGGLRHSGDIA
jgi:hypothetical protein